MLNRLKRAIDRALTSLEGRTGGPEQDVERLLRSMREELVDVRARLPKLEETIQKLEATRVSELKKAKDCARRAIQADEIDDRETVEVALKYEARHTERAQLCDQKLEAARMELALQRQSVKEMTRQLKEARASRGVLEARARRSRATESLRGQGDSAADKFDRLAEQIEDDVMDIGIESELDAEIASGGKSRTAGYEPTSERPIEPDDLADLQLQQLKRRMAEEGGFSE